jgi:hypothetical protein
LGPTVIDAAARSDSVWPKPVPAPTREITVDSAVTVIAQTDEVTVSGTVSCTNTTYIDFYGAVKQLSDNREYISAFFSEYGPECMQTPMPWTITELGDGVFIAVPRL